MTDKIGEIEFELRQAMPRRVRPRSKWWLLISVCVVLINVLAVSLSFEPLHFMMSCRFGSTVPGQITTYNQRQSRRRGTKYFVEYSYRWLGKTYNSSSQISPQDYSALPTGASVQVRVLPITPRLWPFPLLSAQTMARHVRQLWLDAALSCVFPVFTGVWLFSASRSRRLVQHGTATIGRVVQKRKSEDTRRNHNWRIVYEFATDNGTVQCGSMRVEQDQQGDVDEGDVVTVLYERYDPRRSVIYLLSCWKVVA